MVDLRKLDEQREVIDCEVAERSLCTDKPRRWARVELAWELGFILESEEMFGWWFATACPEVELTQIRDAVSNEMMVSNAVREEVVLRCGRSFQAARREDAETAALLASLDADADLRIEVLDYERLYPSDWRLNPRLVWTPFVEFYYDGTHFTWTNAS